MKEISLLPPGFRDDLSPITEYEHEFIGKIISIFNSNNYQIVKPPLVEFMNNDNEDDNVFVIYNDDENKKLKIRNDMTMQVARIATYRLSNEIRPIRLCYYGEVIRNQGSILRPERQFLQIGAECIGEPNLLADIEILDLAFQSLKAVGIKNISVVFSNSIFIDDILNDFNKKEDREEFIKKVKRKDLSSILSMIKEDNKKNFLTNIIDCTGNINLKMNSLDKLKINKNHTLEIEKLKTIYKFLNSEFKEISFNIDLTENIDHNYYSGLNFIVFAKDVRGEIASGGRYLTKFSEGEGGVGFTCYMDTILRASKMKIDKKIILIPFKTSSKITKELIDNHFIIERFFGENDNIESFAKKKKCTHFLVNNKVHEIHHV